MYKKIHLKSYNKVIVVPDYNMNLESYDLSQEGIMDFFRDIGRKIGFFFDDVEDKVTELEELAKSKNYVVTNPDAFHSFSYSVVFDHPDIAKYGQSNIAKCMDDMLYDFSTSHLYDLINTIVSKFLNLLNTKKDVYNNILDSYYKQMSSKYSKVLGTYAKQIFHYETNSDDDSNYIYFTCEFTKFEGKKLYGIQARLHKNWEGDFNRYNAMFGLPHGVVANFSDGNSDNEVKKIILDSNKVKELIKVLRSHCNVYKSAMEKQKEKHLAAQKLFSSKIKAFNLKQTTVEGRQALQGMMFGLNAKVIFYNRLLLELIRICNNSIK